MGNIMKVVNCFKWVKGIIESYNEESDERCFLEVDVQYHEMLHELHNDLSFLPEKVKICKVEKLFS